MLTVGTIIGYKAMLDAGRSIEQVFEAVKNDGGSKIDCIQLLVNIMNMSLEESKRTVHYSSAWKEVSSVDESFHEDSEALLRKLKDSDSE